MAQFKTLLLDLDGTLVDAFVTIHRSYVHVLPQFGLPRWQLPDRRIAG